MELKVVTPPAAEPLSTAEAKLHLRVDHTSDDTLISALIVAAREHVENYLVGSLVEQTRAVYLSAWPYAPFRLPCGPVQSIDSVKYTDSDGAEHTVSTDLYYLSPGGELCLEPFESWPTARLRGPGAIEIVYTTGYEPVVTVIPGEEEGDPDTEETDYGANIPQAIKQAMLLLIGEWYEQREAAADTKYNIQTIPWGVKQLLAPYREATV
jgi:uncharacterized phiE125 gp8 family phage protein